MTLDEAIEKLERSYIANGDAPLDELNCTIHIIAIAVQEQRKEIAELRLLLEHEETVRSKKLRRVTPVKSQSFLRGTKFAVGDRVVHKLGGHGGTVVKVDRNGRVGARLDSAGMTVVRWFKTSELRHAVTSVA